MCLMSVALVFPVAVKCCPDFPGCFPESRPWVLSLGVLGAESPDHSSVLLLPAYRQKLKREAPALRTIQCWSDQSDAILQHCFDHVDWDMFRAASDDDIEAYSVSVTCFIRKCIEGIDTHQQPKKHVAGHQQHHRF